MKRFRNQKALAAVALAAATFTAPALAHAGQYDNRSISYEQCKDKDTEGQIIGGLVGAVAGGVLGSQVSGNGARTEGSAIGALLGAAAGTQIADIDCKGHDGRIYASNYNSRTVYPRRTVGTTGYRTVSSRQYRDNRNYRSDGRGYDNRRGYNNYSYRNNPIDRINRRIDYLRNERHDLKSRRGYGDRRWIDRRLDEIAYELADLKQRRKYLKKRDRRSDRHYHGSNVCYSNH